MIFNEENFKVNMKSNGKKIVQLNRKYNTVTKS